jgi:hypothetical protein
MTTQLTMLLIAAGLGLGLAQLFHFLPGRKSQVLIDRILWAEAAERASAQNDLRRIAKALEHIADQFPSDQPPYFERMLVTLQEWTHVRR